MQSKKYGYKYIYILCAQLATGAIGSTTNKLKSLSCS